MQCEEPGTEASPAHKQRQPENRVRVRGILPYTHIKLAAKR